MEYTINETPLKMAEITAKLFNSQYLSDITFIIEGKYIYAHSLILMLRSSIFQTQLEANLNKKITIPITDNGYREFYQLIQFIYTDQVDISDISDFRLLKLANKYKVIRLVNHLLNHNFHILKKLNFCVTENHRIGLNLTLTELAFGLKSNLDSNEFLSMHPDTVEEILKFNQIKYDVTESYILEALVRWMNHHCNENQIQFSECRNKFAHLIKLIRFPTMSSEEIQNIETKYPELLNKNDLASKDDEDIWNCEPRTKLIWPCYVKEYRNKAEFKTKFSVTSDLILSGFIFGGEYWLGKTKANFIISCQHHRDLNEIFQININEVAASVNYGVVNLGASIRVHPNYIYSIRYVPAPVANAKIFEIWSRKPPTEIIINGPQNEVKILEADANFLEICFLQPEFD